MKKKLYRSALLKLFYSVESATFIALAHLRLGVVFRTLKHTDWPGYCMRYAWCCTNDIAHIVQYYDPYQTVCGVWAKYTFNQPGNVLETNMLTSKLWQTGPLFKFCHIKFSHSIKVWLISQWVTCLGLYCRLGTFPRDQERRTRLHIQ